MAKKPSRTGDAERGATTSEHKAIFASRPTFAQRLKTHYKRWWWLHTLIFIMVVLVVTLPLIYIAYPHTAQTQITESTLSITSMTISNPSPSSYDLSLTGILSNPSHSKYHPHLDSWTASLHLPNRSTPFAEVSIPPIHAATNGTQIRIHQHINITHIDEFTLFTSTVLGAQDFEITARGRGGLKQSGLPRTSVTYDKNVVMKGLNALQTLTVPTFNLLTTPRPDGINANGTLSIPNQSVMTLWLGSVTMNMSVDGTLIGILTVEDLVLRPGENVVDMRAVVNHPAVRALMVDDYECGVFPVDVVGVSAEYAGEQLGYYERPLRGLKVRLDLDVVDVLERAGLVDGLVINGTRTACAPS